MFLADSVRAKAIRNASTYAGVRVTLLAKLGASRTPIQVDIGYGDAVTPAPERVIYPVLLEEFSPPQLRAYPRETVVAEKLETIVLMGIANSRMKDYFDLWMLCKNSTLDRSVLKNSIQATFDRRGTALPISLPIGLSDAFFLDTNKQNQWRAFVRKHRLEDNDLQTVVVDLRRWLGPLLLGDDSRPM